MQKPYYLVIDFEANCSSSETRDHEIIEFPAVLVNAETGEILKEFRHFVQMVTHEKLSEFIKDLTHITDEQVSNGLSWYDCLMEFETWCRENNISYENTTVVTCGDWDLNVMLPDQLRITGTFISPDLKDLMTNWNNVKIPFKKVMKQRGGMKRMMEYLNLELIGQHHSGIDDCRNTARICHELTKKGSDMTRANRSVGLPRHSRTSRR